MEKDSTKVIVDNLELYEKEGYALIRLNPKIYPLDIIYSASYSFLERAYVMLDGDPAREVVVRVRPKEEGGSVEAIARGFNEELLKYASYKVTAEANKDIRWRIVETALGPSCGCEDEEEDEDYLDDPLGIAKPWEETHKAEKRDE